MNKIKVGDLTLNQLEKIQNLNLGVHSQKQTSLLSEYIGLYAIVRSRNEGINAGFIKALDTSMSWYEGVATVGCSQDTKLSNPVEEKIIVEDYSITLCTKEAQEVIQNATTNRQN